MDCLEELEKRVAERGVRVEERRRLLRLLREERGAEALAERQRRLLEAVRTALRELRGGLAR